MESDKGDFKYFLLDGKLVKFKVITKAPSSSSTIPHVPITTVKNHVQKKIVIVVRPKMKQPQQEAAKTTKKEKCAVLGQTNRPLF